MTKKEIIKRIRGYTKLYLSAGIPQSTFSTTLRNIELGVCKPRTESEFFNKIGVSLVTEAEYEIITFDPIGK